MAPEAATAAAKPAGAKPKGKARAARKTAPAAKPVEGQDLSFKEAQEWLEAATSRGEYRPLIADFVASGVYFRRVNTASGPLKGRSLRAIQTGLKGAVKDQPVRIVKREDELGLVRTDQTNSHSAAQVQQGD